MCEFNRPYFVPFGQHPDDRPLDEIQIRPLSEWKQETAKLTYEQAEVIDQAVQDAADIAADVHIYRSIASPLIGISLEPGTGPNVKIWKH